MATHCAYLRHPGIEGPVHLSDKRDGLWRENTGKLLLQAPRGQGDVHIARVRRRGVRDTPRARVSNKVGGKGVYAQHGCP